MEEFTDPLVPLVEAARLAYFEVSGEQTGHEGALNKFARLIAEITRVFTRAHDEDDWHPVMPGEADEGAFHLGGAYLEFPDARPSLGNLAVLRRELPRVLDRLRSRFEAFRPPRRQPG